MRQVASTILLAVMLVLTVGYFPLFKIEQWKVRSAMKHRIESQIPEKLLIKVSFDKAEDIIWIREG